MNLSKSYDFSIDDWLSYQLKSHCVSIDLSLERVKTVYKNLNISPFNFSTVIVGGTNGKGSTLFFLENVYKEAGYKVGKFSSPHIFKYNERICINAKPVDDENLCEAFAFIQKHKNDITLTYFEYSTLAALYIFKKFNVDIALLEVGLGGRLDAVNIIDADCMVITNIDIDHTDYLGSTREKIAYEKAGILRKYRPLVCSDNNPPKSLLDKISSLLVPVKYVTNPHKYTDNIETSHQKINASVAIEVIKRLDPKNIVSDYIIRKVIQYNKKSLIGRIQTINYKNKTFIFDVAHNVHSVLALSQYIKKLQKKTIVAIFSVLADKDIKKIIKTIRSFIVKWYIYPLEGKDINNRGINTNSLLLCFSLEDKLYCANNYLDAFSEVMNSNYKNILVFGSFYTVSDIMKLVIKNG